MLLNQSNFWTGTNCCIMQYVGYLRVEGVTISLTRGSFNFGAPLKHNWCLWNYHHLHTLSSAFGPGLMYFIASCPTFTSKAIKLTRALAICDKLHSWIQELAVWSTFFIMLCSCVIFSFSFIQMASFLIWCEPINTLWEPLGFFNRIWNSMYSEIQDPHPIDISTAYTVG